MKPYLSILTNILLVVISLLYAIHYYTIDGIPLNYYTVNTSSCFCFIILAYLLVTKLLSKPNQNVIKNERT